MRELRSPTEYLTRQDNYSDALYFPPAHWNEILRNIPEIHDISPNPRNRPEASHMRRNREQYLRQQLSLRPAKFLNWVRPAQRLFLSYTFRWGCRVETLLSKWASAYDVQPAICKLRIDCRAVVAVTPPIRGSISRGRPEKKCILTH